MGTSRRRLRGYLALCLRKAWPKAWGVLSLLSTVFGVSTVALVAGVWARSVVAAVAMGALTLLFVLVVGGYRAWDHVDQDREAAQAKLVPRLRRSEVHDRLGQFLLEAMPIRRGLDRHARFVKAQATEDMIPTVDEPEDLEAAALDWYLRLLAYLDEAVAPATGIWLFDLSDHPVESSHRRDGLVLWRDAMAVYTRRLSELVDRYAPDRTPAP